MEWSKKLLEFLVARISRHPVIPQKVDAVRRGCKHLIFPSLGVLESGTERVIPPAKSRIRRDRLKKNPECGGVNVETPLTAFPGSSEIVPRHRAARSLTRPQKTGDQSLCRE